MTTQRIRIVIQLPSQIGLAVGAFLTLQFHFLFLDSSVGVNTTMTDIRAIGHPEGNHKNWLKTSLSFELITTYVRQAKWQKLQDARVISVITVFMPMVNKNFFSVANSSYN